MILGISSFSYGWNVGVSEQLPETRLDSVGLLKRAVELDVRLVQFGDNLPLHSMEEAQLDTIASLSADKGLAIEIGARGLLPDHIIRYLTLAERFGSTTLRVVVDRHDFKPTPNEVVSILQELVPELATKNVVLAIENHDRFPSKVLADIIKRVGSDCVGICLDTANSLGAGEGIETVVDTLGPFTVNLHIKDFYISRLSHQMGFTVEGRPAGQGMLDIPWLLDKLRLFRRDPNAIVELWTPPETRLVDTMAKEMQWVRESVHYMRPLVVAYQERFIRY